MTLVSDNGQLRLPRFKHKYLDVRRFASELILALLLFVAVFLLASELNLSEALYLWSQQVDVYQLDELMLSVLVVGPLYLAIFAYRRLREIRHLVEEANTDALTGILNRRRAMELLSHEVRRAHRRCRAAAIWQLDRAQQPDPATRRLATASEWPACDGVCRARAWPPAR